MENSGFDPGTGEILVTGGTSGLGLELAKLFHRKGFTVVVTGRDPSGLPEGNGRLKFVFVDFADLKGTAETFTEIAGIHTFSMVINNAGILSPLHYMSTKDGFEYTFQVNFLAHLLLDEIIISKKSKNLPLLIVSVTSPVYRLRRMRSGNILTEKNYNPAKAYSGSKYLLSLMCKNLSFRYRELHVSAISFDPGVFRSAIFRMQNPFLRSIYAVAVPFMRDPLKVAQILAAILERNKIEGGMIYNLRNKVFSLPMPDASEEAFLGSCLEKIRPFLNPRT